MGAGLQAPSEPGAPTATVTKTPLWEISATVTHRVGLGCAVTVLAVRVLVMVVVVWMVCFETELETTGAFELWATEETEFEATGGAGLEVLGGLAEGREGGGELCEAEEGSALVGLGSARLRCDG